MRQQGKDVSFFDAQDNVRSDSYGSPAKRTRSEFVDCSVMSLVACSVGALVVRYADGQSVSWGIGVMSFVGGLSLFAYAYSKLDKIDAESSFSSPVASSSKPRVENHGVHDGYNNKAKPKKYDYKV